MREEPVHWSEIPGSKLSPARDALRMLAGTVALRRRLRRAGVAPPPAGPAPDGSPGTSLIDCALLLALFAAACGPFLLRAFRSAVPGGLDGVAHYAIADLYARQVFPAISGWLPEYFGGMPFPNFYPPAFYFAVAALTRLGLSTAAATWSLQALGAAALPLLTYLCARRLSASRSGGLAAGALAVGVLIHRHPLWLAGISLPSTFNTGLYTHLPGYCFALASCYFLLDVPRSPRTAAPAVGCLALVPLTNIPWCGSRRSCSPRCCWRGC